MDMGVDCMTILMLLPGAARLGSVIDPYVVLDYDFEKVILSILNLHVLVQ